MIKCPECGSPDYYYDGLFIRCNTCRYTQWAKEINGKLEDIWVLWQVEEKKVDNKRGKVDEEHRVQGDTP